MDPVDLLFAVCAVVLLARPVLDVLSLIRSAWERHRRRRLMREIRRAHVAALELRLRLALLRSSA